MVKLARKYQKIFGLGSGRIGQFGSQEINTPTYSTDVEEIQELSAYEGGWDDATISGEKAPTLPEFNGLQYCTDYQIAYLMQEGIPEYNSDTTYYIGSLVKLANSSKIYRSLTDDNSGNILSDDTNWQYCFDFSTIFGNTVFASDFGTSLNDATLQAAIDYIDTAEKKLIVTAGEWTIDDNITFPSNIVVEFEKGAILNVDTGITVTINGGIETPLSQIFDGDGDVVFGNKVTDVFAEWWGVSVGGADNDSRFLKMAENSVGKILNFQNGIYSLTSEIGDSTTIFGDGKIHWKGGSNTTIQYNSESITHHMIGFDSNENNVMLENIDFDGNYNCHIAIEIHNQCTSMANAVNFKASNCRFQKAYRASTDFIGGDCIMLRGGFKEVIFEKCIINDAKMAASAGVSGSQGISGVTVTYYDIEAYPEKVVLDGTTIEKVWCEDLTYTDDQDGLKVFAPPPTDNGNLIVLASLIVTKSIFKNCYGRSIKSQVMFNDVSNGNTFIRDEGFTRGYGNGEIDCQYGGGIVHNNEAYYTNTNPDTFVTTTYRGYACGSFGTSVKNNAIYHTGSNPFTTCLVSPVVTNASSRIKNIDIENNHVNAVIPYLAFFRSNGDDSNVFNVNNNRVKECTTALIAVKIASTDAPHLAYVNVSGNVNENAASPVALVLDQIAGGAMSAIVSGHGNFGFVERGYAHKAETTPNVEIFRPLQIAPKYGEYVGSFMMESTLITNTSSFAFSARGFTQGTGMYFLSANDINSHCLFIADNSGTISVYAGSNIALGTTSDPGTAGKISIWIDATSKAINITNRIGTTKVVTLAHLG